MSLSGGNERAVSQTIGYILLISVVITATGVTVMIGSEAIGGLQASNDVESAATTMQSVDSQLSSLTMVTDASTSSFEVPDSEGGYTTVERGGSLQINVSGGDQYCRASVPLGSIRYERQGRIVGYEAGGIWERSPGGGSAMTTPPDVTFRNGILGVSTVNLTGDVSTGENDVTLNETRSRASTVVIESALQDCQRVSTLNVSVNSSFHEAWGEYLAEETGGTLYDDTQTAESDTVRVVLDSDQLPRRANYEKNNVINMSESANYMDDVTIDSDSISVDKGTDNTYLVSVNSLARGPPDVDYVTPLSAGNVTNRTRAPIDVAFVIDESGSMGNGNKIGNAKDAAEVAVGTMNTSHIGDRASVIGYTSYSDQRFVGANERYFSSNSDEVNGTINSLHASGSTDIASGLNASIAALSTRERSRQAHVILLTDGENSPGGKCDEYGIYDNNDCRDFFDERTMNAARIADSKGYTVHTFAYGGGADDELLEDVADETGGTFHEAGTGDELEEVFASVVSDITQSEPYVVRTPLSTNFTTGDGQTNAPQIVGDTDSIASHSTGGETFLNVNDPTAPTLFSHSFAISGGEEAIINATTYTCDEWESTGQTEELTVGGETSAYPVARCTEIDATNESLPDDDITINENGDDASWLMTGEEINESLDPYVNNTNDQFALDSNQVVVTFDFPDSRVSPNHLSLVYEVGLSESEARAGEVVNVQVSEVDVE